MGRYTGPAYPFGPDPVGVMGPKSDVAVVYTSICNILTTPLGSVPYDPLMGSVIPLLVFDLQDEITAQLVRYYTVRDISDQEPRVVVVSCYTEMADPHTIVVTVGFQLVGDPTGATYSAPVLFPREG